MSRTIIYHGKPSGSLADPPGSMFHCSRCCQIKPAAAGWGGGTGYRVTRDNLLMCYRCCAQTQRLAMTESGKATLYLCRNDDKTWSVTDWAGELRFSAYHVQRMVHPFARSARIAYFTGPDGKRWSAKNIGDQQLAHCRRLKSAVS